MLAWEADGHIYSGDDVPWSMMPLLGSDERMRGYYQGRYRDKNVVSSQLEYRRQLTWRHGVVVWVGAGTMGSSIDSLNDGRWLPSAGVGYRFEFKPRVNIRLDYGVGKGSSGLFTSRSAKRSNSFLPSFLTLTAPSVVGTGNF